MLREYSFRKANTNYGRKERIMQVTLTHLPDTAAEFEALSRRTPEEVCACFLCALNLYIKDKDAGVAAMDLLRGPRPMTPYDAQFLRDRLRGKEYLPLAYFEGAAPENSYTPAQPYVLNVLPDPRPQDMEPGYLRLFLQTAGADSPPSHQAAAEALYRGMVFVGVFQPLERHPHPRRAGPVGMTRWERDVWCWRWRCWHSA